MGSRLEPEIAARRRDSPGSLQPLHSPGLEIEPAFLRVVHRRNGLSGSPASLRSLWRAVTISLRQRTRPTADDTPENV